MTLIKIIEQQHQIAVNNIKIELELTIMQALIRKRMEQLSEMLGEKR